jgi:hypothetical protein
LRFIALGCNNGSIKIFTFLISFLIGSAGQAQTFAIPPKFEYAGQFSEGLAPVIIGGKKGYINKSGVLVIDAQHYDAIYPFSNGLAKVLKKDKFGFIDKNGNLVIKARFKNASDFKNERAIVSFHSTLFGPDKGVINKDGKFLVNPYLEMIHDFSEQFAVADFGGKGFSTFGLIDHSGNTVIPPKFEYLRGFQEGLSAALIPDGGWGFINYQGDWVIPPHFDALQNFSGGYAVYGECAKKIKKPFDFSSPSCLYGYINRGGKVAIQPQFRFASNFSDSRAIVSFNYESVDHKLIFVPSVNYTFGFIDEQGILVIDSIYSSVNPFRSGIAAVQKIIDEKKKMRWGYIDKNGRELTQFVFEYAESLSEGLAAVRVSSGKWGYISFQ